MAHIRLATILVLLASLLPASASAQLSEAAADIRTHLEFLGYEVTVEEDNVAATHESKLDIYLRDYQGGMLMQSYVLVVSNKDEALPTANLLNTGAAATRFYIDSDGDLAVEAWMPGGYEKARFAAFLEAWDADTLGQFRTYSEEIRRLVN